MHAIFAFLSAADLAISEAGGGVPDMLAVLRRAGGEHKHLRTTPNRLLTAAQALGLDYNLAALTAARRAGLADTETIRLDNKLRTTWWLTPLGIEAVDQLLGAGQ